MIKEQTKMAGLLSNEVTSSRVENVRSALRKNMVLSICAKFELVLLICAVTMNITTCLAMLDVITMKLPTIGLLVLITERNAMHSGTNAVTVMNRLVIKPWTRLLRSLSLNLGICRP